ncbi:hypothetical protein BDIM_13360 [Brevundimonas diminuta ATCC 11568]|nr:hypothetical protein BDIM_13360 [Brevundimonas diminuta ATCC 11568]
MIGAFVGGVITGGGAGWALTLRMVKQKLVVAESVVNQRGARAGGDVVGRDKTTN